MNRKYFFGKIILPLLSLCLFGAFAEAQDYHECTCDSLWQKKEAIEFTRDLELAGKDSKPVWGDYYLGKGEVILNAGMVSDSSHCLGIWKDGKLLSQFRSPEVPKMLTPLYSYYFEQLPLNDDFEVLASRAEDAPAFRAWMNHLGIESAVYMPVSFPNFPFEIPAMTKVQLAIHESFHVEVQLPKWFYGTGYWPDWDHQPDRSAVVQRCYSETEPVGELITKEQQLLSDCMERLFVGEKKEACSIANQFLMTRKSRYQLLDTVQIVLHDETMGSCKTAESIMELEEGLADYASWSQLYQLELVDDEGILKRYRAIQKDKFYLTGAMMMHAIEIMENGRIELIIEDIVKSETLEEGALIRQFEKALKSYKKK